MPTPLLDRVSLGGMNAFYWLLSFGAAGFSMWFAIQYSTNRFFVPPAAPSYPYGQVHPVLHEGHCEGPRAYTTGVIEGCHSWENGSPDGGSWRGECDGFHTATGLTFPARDCQYVPNPNTNYSAFQPLFDGHNWDVICPQTTSSNGDGYKVFHFCAIAVHHEEDERGTFAKRFFLFIHYLVGLGSLGVMLVPLLSTKGSLLHVRTGQVYVVCMAVGMLTVFILMPLHERALRPMDWFLLMIAVFTSCMIYDGVRVLRLKSRTESHLRRMLRGRATKADVFDVALSAGSLAFSIYVMAHGFAIGDGLLSYFPILPISIHTVQLYYWATMSLQILGPRCGQPERMHWWYFHTVNMCGSCIATFTAFIVTNDTVVFGPAGGGVAPWILPGAILGPAIFLWNGWFSWRFLEELPRSLLRAVPALSQQAKAADVESIAAAKAGGTIAVRLPAAQRTYTVLPPTTPPADAGSSAVAVTSTKAAPGAAAAAAHDRRAGLQFTPSDLIAVIPHHSGEVFAISASCAHEHGPLGSGDIEDLASGPAIVCPTHRYAFDLRTGECVSAPESRLLFDGHVCTTGRGAPPACTRSCHSGVPVYPAHREGDEIVVALPTQAWTALRVVERKLDGTTLRLTLEGGGAVAPPAPGEHIMLRAPYQGGATVNGYRLCERPYSPFNVVEAGGASAGGGGAWTLDLAIRVVAGGGLTPTLALLKVGETVEAKLGGGLGKAHNQAALDGALVLAGSGTGVAPLLRVAQAATHPQSVRMVVSRARWAEAELARLESAGVVVTRLGGDGGGGGRGAGGAGGAGGRLRAADLTGGGDAGQPLSGSTVLYAGGPTFCGQVRVALKKLGHADAFEY